ncbi:MAG: hypothetical protein QF824_01260 [Candidatus Woesearchaeota archaeon]|nr:hypothetical protein [Candidatus Woesearchaeota archaeon]
MDDDKEPINGAEHDIGKLEERIKRCRLPGMLESESDAQRLVFDIVRTGRRVNRRSVATEVVYRLRGPQRTLEDMGHYRNNRISTDGLEVSDRGLLREDSVSVERVFADRYGRGRLDDFYFANRILIPWAVGEGTIRTFNFAQRRHNWTGKQRKGGEVGKDARSFVHPARVAGNLHAYGAPLHHRVLGLLHDVIEDVTDYRLELFGGTDDEVRRAEYVRDIRNPPEYEGVREIFTFGRSHVVVGEDDLEKEVVDSSDAELKLYQLRLLTKDRDMKGVGQDYGEYMSELVEGCLGVENYGLVSNVVGDSEEMELYIAAPLIVKAADAIDNTNWLYELELKDRVKRFERNIEVLRGIDVFLEHYEPQLLVDLRTELIVRTFGEIQEMEDHYRRRGAKDYAMGHVVFDGIRKFREAYGRYEAPMIKG